MMGFYISSKKKIDLELSSSKYASIGDDASTDLSSQSVHLLSIKANNKERIVSVFSPEKGDAPGLAKAIVEELKRFPLFFDQIRMGDIKIINVCCDGASLNPAMVRELGELAEVDKIEGLKGDFKIFLKLFFFDSGDQG